MFYLYECYLSKITSIEMLESLDSRQSCGLDPASTRVTEAACYEAEDESESQASKAEDRESRPRGQRRPRVLQH